MKFDRTLVTLELLSGILGWIWIACSIGILAAIGGALISDWSWWKVLYFALAGGAAKWLARGFLDSKQRVIFERQAIAHGATPHEAAEAWTKTYLNGGRP